MNIDKEKPKTIRTQLHFYLYNLWRRCIWDKKKRPVKAPWRRVIWAKNNDISGKDFLLHRCLTSPCTKWSLIRLLSHLQRKKPCTCLNIDHFYVCIKKSILLKIFAVKSSKLMMGCWLCYCLFTRFHDVWYNHDCERSTQVLFKKHFHFLDLKLEPKKHDKLNN